MAGRAASVASPQRFQLRRAQVPAVLRPPRFRPPGRPCLDFAEKCCRRPCCASLMPPEGGNAAGRVSRPKGHVTGPKGRATGPMGRDPGPKGRGIGPKGRGRRPLGRVTGPEGRAAGPRGRVIGPKGRASRPKGRVSGPMGRAVGPRGRDCRPKGRGMRAQPLYFRYEIERSSRADLRGSRGGRGGIPCARPR